MSDGRAAIAPPLPNWPILLSTAMAARYLSLDEHSFGVVADKAGVRPVDLNLPLVRWRRSELDRLVARLSSAPAAEAATRGAPEPDQAEILIQRIVQGVTARVTNQPTEPPPHSMSLKDAARTIGVSRSTLYRLVSEGRLPTHRIGQRVLVKRSDVEALFDRPPPAPAGARGRPRRA